LRPLRPPVWAKSRHSNEIDHLGWRIANFNGRFVTSLLQF